MRVKMKNKIYPVFITGLLMFVILRDVSGRSICG